MRAILIVLALVAGCSSPPYLCSAATDLSGRRIPVCHDANQVPVCDTPGMTAMYVMGTPGYTLQGGTLAVCDSSSQVVCQDRTISPHCIVQPIAH